VRLLTPLAAGGMRHEQDAVVRIDSGGRITAIEPGALHATAAGGAPLHDLRPLVLLPGMVDLHLHLPQIPNAGLGAGLDLLTWLDRYIFPLERDFDRAAAERLAPRAFRALAAAGTTTVVAYAALWPDSTDACFAAAEAHGIRAVIGKVMMDRSTYDDRIQPARILETSLRQAADLCERWHGRDNGRLRYAFTPRFAVSCTPQLLAESARLAALHGAYWQTHLSEDATEMDEVRRLFPAARDYLDVYERAGGVTDHAILAHAIHLSDDEVDRLAASRASVAHCPASNLFLSSGMMRAAAYVERGVLVGLGTDLAAGPEMSMFGVMRAAAVSQRVLLLNGALAGVRPLAGLDWLRMATLDGARALGLDGDIGSVEVGKEADMILVDPSLTAPLPGDPTPDDADELMGRLIFRGHPDMVSAAWVRGKLLPGVDSIG
jgi:guanine deaminase